MAQTHELKEWIQTFGALIGGARKHEVRVRDRDYKIGDTLIIKEYKPQQQGYTGRSVQATVFSVNSLDFLGNTLSRDVVSMDLVGIVILPTVEAYSEN